MKIQIFILGLFLIGCSQNKNLGLYPSVPQNEEQRQHIAASLADGIIPSPDEEPEQSKLTPCELFQKRLKDDAQFSKSPEWIQQSIDLPEDYAHPEGNRVQVFYYYRPLNAGDIPVVFFNGGPLSSSHSSYTAITQAQAFQKSWKPLNFIFIDQRGTGCSSLPPAGSTQDILKRLAFYGSIEIVRDAEEIRKAILGEQAWHVFGQSYGAMIAHRYSVVAPEKVRAYHAHGNAITSSPEDRFYWRIASQFRVNKEYLRQYPSDQSRLEALKKHFTLDYCKEKVCGLSLFSPFNSRLGFTNNWLTVHKWLSVMVPDGATVSEDGVDAFYESLVKVSEPSQINPWTGRIIDYADRDVLSFTYENCSKIIPRLAQEGMRYEETYINECGSSLQRKTLSRPVDLSFIPRRLISVDDFKAALAKTTTPFYLYSGEKDPYVPKEYFAEEVAALGSRIMYQNFSDTGHDGYTSEPVVWLNLLKN